MHFTLHSKRRTKRFPGKSPANPGKCFSLAKPTKVYSFHATFLTQKDVPNVFPANPRQIPPIFFALKRPTKLKMSIKPKKIYAFHATFLTKKYVPNVFPANPRQMPANVFAF